MTDEELANQYVQNDALFVNNKVTIESVKRAFLAGLKAGRPKWYRLQGGIQILPAVDEIVLNEHGDKVVYIGRGMWKAYSEEYVEIDAPVAWCEIPQYMEDVEG